jgi:hypothetical protein
VLAHLSIDVDEFGDEGGYGGGGDLYGGGDPYGSGGYGDPYGGGADGGYGGSDYGSHDGGATVAPPKELKSMAEILDFISQSEIESTVIGYFDLDTNKEDKIIFDEVPSPLPLSVSLSLAVDLSMCPSSVQAHRIGQYRYNFGFTTDKALLKEMKYSGCAVIVYRPVCLLHLPSPS